MNILVGYDGSNVAKDALQLAQKHAKIWNAKIEVVRHLDQSRELGYEEIQKAEDLSPSCLCLAVAVSPKLSGSRRVSSQGAQAWGKLLLTPAPCPRVK